MWSFVIGDTPMWMTIAKYAKIGYIDEVLATRRILEHSASHIPSPRERIKFTQSMFESRFYFIKKYGCSEETKKKVYSKYNRKLLEYGFILKDKHLAKTSYAGLLDINENLTLDDHLQKIGTSHALLWFLVKLILFIKRFPRRLSNNRHGF